jgi:hypothetical protein
MISYRHADLLNTLTHEEDYLPQPHTYIRGSKATPEEGVNLNGDWYWFTGPDGFPDIKVIVYRNGKGYDVYAAKDIRAMYPGALFVSDDANNPNRIYVYPFKTEQQKEMFKHRQMKNLRKADLLNTLNQDVAMPFDVLFRFEDDKVQMIGYKPEDRSISISAAIAQKGEDLLDIIKSCTGVMGFYNDDYGIWSYNTFSRPTDVVMSVAQRLKNFGDPRVVSVRDSIGHNISNDRMTMTVWFK